MPPERSAGKPTTRRYSQEEKAAAVRMVRTLRVELGHDHCVVKWVAEQLGPVSPPMTPPGCYRVHGARKL
ncbi:hypothetical protein EV378_5899 [Pseudonocardia endophytica]|uniref:Transposase n=1 Tax=Pseudonocardia endophytica TaxID=401976 RepID=A0A4R1HI41_PSEEN|nr:hypothetical protein EV378_5899 [Pseudonocardia endophytica]